MSRPKSNLTSFLSHHAGKLALAAAIAAGVVHYGADAGAAESPPAEIAAPVVEFTVVQPVELREWNNYSGRLAAVQSAEIKPLVGGTIMEVLFEDGQLVQAGDPLFVIDPRPHQNALSQAQATLATAQSRLDLAKDEFARNERLHDTGLVSDSVFDTARSNLQVAEAGVLQAQSALDQARLALEYAHVRAPISGRASRAELTVGNVVDAGPNAPVLTSVVADDVLYAEFNVDEQTYVQLAQSRHGGAMPVELSLAQDQDRIYHGTIHSFDNRLDSTSGTIRARALITNTDGVLTPGLYVNVRVGSPQTNPVLLVPERAVGTNQSRKFVYVVDAQDLVQYREVTLGSNHKGNRVVLSGLEPGDQVVVNGISHIAAPNTPVNPVQLSADELVVSR